MRMIFGKMKYCQFLSLKDICLVFAILLAATTVNADVKVFQSDNAAVIENGLVKFVYDLSSGTYDAIDKRNEAVCIKDGFFQLNDISSKAQGFVHGFKSREISDELGEGKILSIECVKPSEITLLFEVALYKDKSYVVFQGGIENSTSNPFRVKSVKPISKATIFPSFDMKKNFRMLDGNSGGEHLEWGVKKYTAVYDGNYVFSRNNALVTFGENETRRSMVLGGLTYHDLEKFAVFNQPRKLELTTGPDGDDSLVCYLNLPAQKEDIGSAGECLSLLDGKDEKQFRYDELWGEEIATASAGKDGVAIEASKLDKNSKYYLGFLWWHGDRKTVRVQSVSVDNGEGTKKYVLLNDKTVPAWNWITKDDPEQVELQIPSEAINAGKIRILFDNNEKDVPAVVSEVWLRKGNKPLLSDKLTKITDTQRALYSLTGQLYAEDPVGKLVDPGNSYFPDDRFYVDFVTDNPFENLEQYGWSIRLAQKIDLNMYDFPTVCMWFANENEYSEGKGKNDTVGAVNEIELIAKSGFMKYSRAAVRLVPDCYDKNNQQGWWDDEHFQMRGSSHLDGFEGGTYKAPYETSEKWGKAVTERGGIPLTYCQTGFRSEDYAQTFPGHMLFNKSIAWMDESKTWPMDDDEFWGNAWTKSFNVWSYDYTDPGFIKHVKEVYANFRSGGIKGLMFDYPARGWAYGGGMEDKYSTTASAYRNIFQLAKDGLGPEYYIHERNLERGSDITLGVVTSMRTENDTSRIDPGVVTRCGLRWYKNRVVVNYDPDGKNVYKLRDNRDAVRSLLTMCYVTTGRFLLANSFSQLTPEIIADLTRIFPFHETPKTARPVDAFKQKYPRVYDFEVSPSWHQLTFYNIDNDKEMDIEVQLAGSTAEGTLGLCSDDDYYVYDFWNDKFVGKFSGAGKISQQLRPAEARMMSVHQVKDHPQFISTDRHLMQGYVDMSKKPKWSKEGQKLHGTSSVIGWEPYRITIALNGYSIRKITAKGAQADIEIRSDNKNLADLVLKANENRDVSWKVTFRK